MDLFKREPKQQEVQEPPEHSVALRLVVFLMAALCVGSSCYFSRVEPLIWVLFMVTVLTGSYLSYLYRNDDNKWLRRIAFIGIIAVGYLAGKRFLSPLSTEYDFVSPFVIFLAGVFSSLCFEMRSRSDLNLSSGLGLLLLCITAPVSRGLLYGGVVLSYILLGGLMLYFDCLSRTLNAWLDRKIEDAPMLDFAKSSGGRRRNRFGSTLGLLAFFPLLAAMMFLFMPRIDSFLDMTMAYAKTLNPDYVLDMAMGSQGPSSRPPQDKGQSARDWFQKNSQVLSNLKKNEKKDEKTKEKLASTQPNQDKKGVPEPKKDKDKSKPQPGKKQDQPKAKEVKKGEEGKKDDAGELKPKPQDKKKVGKSDAKSAPEKKKDLAKPSKGKGAPVSDKKSDSESKSGSRSAGKSKDSKGGKVSGAKSGGAGGKGGSSGGGGAGPGHGEGKSIVIKDDEVLDTHDPFVASEAPILKVTSRRLAYLRRQCYDKFDGRYWTHSGKASAENANKYKNKNKNKNKSNGKQTEKQEKSVKVVDGVVQRESLKEAIEKAATTRQTAPVAVAPQPVSTGSILMKSGPISKQEGIVMGTGGTGTGTTATAVPAPVVEAKSKSEETDDDPVDLVSRIAKGRKFEFLSRERPLFRVGLADALSVPPKYPSISMTQEVEVLTSSIGKVVPGAWIPQEVIVNQKELSVDRLGVMRVTADLKARTKFKVKTELPIFNTAYMRQRPPMGAVQEEVIRDNFAPYLQLPETISDTVFETAESNTSPEYNWFVQSEQLANYLRDNYKINYDAKYDDSEDSVRSFLESDEGGQSSHFASAFVILNRCVGIPSRLVVGFAPGELDHVSGTRTVRGKDVQSWAESYIPEFGWVPFDPTPEGFLPAQKRETEYTADDIKEDLGLNEEEKKRLLEQALNIATWILGLLALIAMLFVLGRKFLPKLLAWWRARRVRGQEWKHYKKVLKAVKTSTSLDREPQETPTEFTFRVRQTVDRLSREGQPTPSGLPDSLDQFMQLYTDIYFGQRKGKMEDLKYYADLVSTHARNRK